ncbi:hypothetical protein [Amycolatopsis tolypomycina]|uniref:hypothetical protein n=1 Tax=Amycolatopsis tolypomycina TaxID=208445 RepID=UPI00115F868E|nr:hypothetical protein [Amycolatopsis tolypomycina]
MARWAPTSRPNQGLTWVEPEKALTLTADVVIPDYVAGAGGILYTLSREAEGLDHDAVKANATTPLHEAAALAGRRLTSGAEPRTPSPRALRTTA